MPSENNARGLPDLLGDLVTQSSTLVREEVRLVRAEMNEKVGQVGTAAGSIGVAGALLLAGLVILLQAVAAFLVSFGLSVAVSHLLVGLVVAAIGYGMLRAGLNRMKATNLTPERTTRQVAQDATVVKESVR